jgi:hypothetical protein
MQKITVLCAVLALGLAACSEGPTEQSSAPAEPVFSHGGGGAHLVVEDQASCEALTGGGLTFTWTLVIEPFCVITGTGVLTAVGDQIIFRTVVQNDGYVTNNGDLINTDDWLNHNRFVNNGTLTGEEGWHDQLGGSTDNYGSFSVEPGGGHSVTGISGVSTFNNYGTYTLGDILSIRDGGIFNNFCGSTFTIEPGGSLSRDPVTTVPCTPEEEVALLDDMVTDLEDAGVLNTGNANSLHRQLAHALEKIERGQTHAAIQILMAFVQHVEGLISDGQLTIAEGQPLIDAANALIADLSA